TSPGPKGKQAERTLPHRSHRATDPPEARERPRQSGNLGPERPPAEQEPRARAAPGRAGTQGLSGPRQSGNLEFAAVHRAWKRIGILGGTFDPPHVGHVVAAVAAIWELELDQVLLMTANIPWQKVGVRA